MKDRGRGSGRQPLGSPGAVRAGRREFGGGDDVGDLIKKVIIYVTASISRELRRKKGLPAYLNFPLKVTRRHSSSRHFVFSVGTAGNVGRIPPSRKKKRFFPPDSNIA